MKKILTSWLVIFLQVLLVFSPFFFVEGNHYLSHYGEDITTQFIHWRKFAFESLKSWDFPLWNPHIFGGAPFFSGLQTSILYPFSWVHFVLPLRQAINFEIIFHVIISGITLCSWARFRGASDVASAFAGISFALSGPVFLHIYPGHISNLNTIAWMPLLFLAADMILNEKHRQGVIVGTFALSLAFFAGHMQYIYYTSIALWIYMFCRRATIKKVISVASFYVYSIFISAIHILPAFILNKETLRGKPLPYEMASAYSFPPENLLSLILPDFFGITDYWGRGYLFWEMQGYFGLTAFVLTLLSLDKRNLKLLIVALVMVVLSFGNFSPVYDLLYQFFPMWGNFRGVSKCIFPAVLCLSVLSAHGFDKAILFRSKLYSVVGFVLLGIAVVLFSLNYTLGKNPALWAGIQKKIEDMDISMIHGITPNFFSISNSFISSAVIVALLGFIFYLSYYNRKGIYFLLLVLCGEMFLFSVKRIDYFSESELPKFEKAMKNDKRLYVHGQNNFAMTFGRYSIWGEDPFALSRYVEFMALINGNQKPTQMISIFSFDNPLMDIIRLQRAFFMQGAETISILKKSPIDRFNFIARYRVVKDDKALAALISGELDFRKEIILDAEPAISTESCEGAKVMVSEERSSQYSIDVSTPCNTILWVTDNYSNYLKITGGYEILKANYFQYAIPLKRGNHNITISYSPRIIYIAAMISFVSILISLILILCRIKNKKMHGACEKNSQVFSL